MKKIKVIYGDIALKISDKISKIPHFKSNPAFRMPFCHQSAFVKTELLKKYKFDTNFKICADNDFFTKIYHLENARFFNSKEIVALYDGSGISAKPSVIFFKEEIRIIAKYNKLYIPIFCVKFLNMRLKYFIKTHLPQNLSIKLQLHINAKR
ncbi:hypothetical protein ACWIUD_04340 [Helicobacter sp. 23-1044]